MCHWDDCAGRTSIHLRSLSLLKKDKGALFFQVSSMSWPYKYLTHKTPFEASLKRFAKTLLIPNCQLFIYLFFKSSSLTLFSSTSWLCCMGAHICSFSDYQKSSTEPQHESTAFGFCANADFYFQCFFRVTSEIKKITVPCHTCYSTFY